MQGSIVILWWGPEIRILGPGGKSVRRTLETGEDPVTAILRMLERECSGGKTVRIIYHPDTLDAHEISCPNTNRTRLKKEVLGREFRALNAPDAIWSAEPIRKGLKGYGTVLYIDNHSRLPDLLEGLASRSLRVEGAWPLPSLVEATPPCDRREGGFLSLVAMESRALISCAGLSGDRSVRFYEGSEFADASLAEARTSLARFEESAPPPGLMIIEEGPHAGIFRDAMRARGLTEMPLASFLERASHLTGGGFSDFVPRKPFFDRRRFLRQMPALFGIVLLLVSAGAAWSTRQNQERARRQTAAWRQQHTHLQQWVANRLALEGKIGQLTKALDRAQSGAQFHYEFLTSLASATPKTIALQAVTIRGSAFSLQGHIYEGAGRPDNPMPPFCRDLAPPEAHWHLWGVPPKNTDSDFTLQGSFQAPSTEISPP